MENKVKNYIRKEYEHTKRHGNNCSVDHAIDRCLGVIMFALDELNCDSTLGDWWDDKMLPKFRKLKEEKAFQEKFYHDIIKIQRKMGV